MIKFSIAGKIGLKSKKETPIIRWFRKVTWETAGIDN